MISCQMGAAPVIPDAMPLMRELSLFPTHAATTYEGVYPIVQLSLKSLVVPVLTDTIFLFILSSDDAPNSCIRALLSDKILEIMNATPSGSTFVPKMGLLGGVYSSST